MKISMYFGKAKSALIIAVAVAAAAVIAADALMLANVIKNANAAVAAVSLAFAVLIIGVCCLILLNSFYRFTEDKLEVRLAFFTDRVEYKDISVLKQNSLTQETFLFYTLNGEDGVFRINLKPNDNKNFVVALREKCDGLTIEFFTPDKK